MIAFIFYFSFVIFIHSKSDWARFARLYQACKSMIIFLLQIDNESKDLKDIQK